MPSHLPYKPGGVSLQQQSAAQALAQANGTINNNNININNNNNNNSSSLVLDNEVDLGDISKVDPKHFTESERLARLARLQHQRKTTIFHPSFEHNIKHVPPGSIGKLIIYKSGKCKIKIGDVMWTLREGMEVTQHQQLVSVATGNGNNSSNENNNNSMVDIDNVNGNNDNNSIHLSRDCYSLGDVDHRFVATLDVDDWLSNQPKWNNYQQLPTQPITTQSYSQQQNKVKMQTKIETKSTKDEIK